MPLRHRATRLALVLLAGCTFQTRAPSSQSIHCDPAGAACPAGYTCRATIGRCVANSVAALPPATVVDASVSPAVGNAQATFTLAFHVSAELDRAPAVAITALRPGTSQAESYPFACEACAELACRCTWTPDPAHLPPEGPLPVQVSLVDAAGNAPEPAQVATLVLDTTPPGLTGPPALSLTAPPGVDTQVLALGDGAQAQVCFGVDEQLGQAPEVWAGADGGLHFDPAPGSPQGLSYCYRAQLTDTLALPDGPLDAQVLLVDVAGNAAVVPLADSDGGALLAVDRTPPGPPDLSDGPGLRYHRAPWGELPQIGRPRLAVLSSGPALSEPGTLLVYSDAAETLELGRARVGPGQPVDVELAPADHPEVWVDEADLAGNRLLGGAVRVRQVDWVATLGNKTRDDPTSNPHDCYARARQGRALEQRDDGRTALEAATGPTGRDGGAAVLGAASWRRRSSGVPDQSTLAYAYDPAWGVLTGFNSDGRTISFDGLDWSFPQLLLEPGQREDLSMAFDRGRGRVVLFGGIDQTVSSEPLCDLWELGASGWELSSPCTEAPDGGAAEPGLPTPRSDACLGYDPARRRVVLLGGLDVAYNPLDDGWTWDGAAWAPLDVPAGLACLRNTLAYDERADGGDLVLLGAGAAGGTTTWVGRWTGQTYDWQAPLADLPGELAPQALAADPASGDLVLVAIRDPESTFAVELWRWDGSSPQGWQLAGQVPTDATTGPGYTYGLAAHPSLYGEPSLTLLESGGDATDRTWLCSVSPFSCRKQHSGSVFAFPPSSLTPLAYADTGRGLVAGLPFSATNPNLEAFGWDGADWSSADAAPPWRQQAVLGPSPGGDGFWLLGGIWPDGGAATDLWTWAPATSWSLQSTTVGDLALPNTYSIDALAPIPDAGLPPGLVAAGSGGPILLVTEPSPGAFATQLLADAGPTGSFAYDQGRHRAVISDLYGNSFWEATPPDFTFQRIPDAGAPLAATLVYDADQQMMLAVGGAQLGASAVRGAVARWDGATLSRLPLTDPDADGDPEADAQPSAAYDPGGHKTRLVTVPLSRAETQSWELDLPRERPALVCQFRFASAHAPVGAAWTRLRVDVDASARGPQGAPVDTVLSLWSGQAWQEVQRGPAGTLAYATSDPSAIAPLLTDLETLGVSLAPALPNGAGLAGIEVGATQVTVSYALP